jgi:hypothetical protein
MPAWLSATQGRLCYLCNWNSGAAMKESRELKNARILLSKPPGGERALAIVENAWDEECRGSGLYPQTLFHFTDKKGLLGILESNFQITYSLERIECRPIKGTGKNGHKDMDEMPINRVFGAPMVSFCDLRLSELGVHMRDYGSYGIGMSKEWAIESDLNPVYYISARAKLLEQFISSMAELFKQRESSCELNTTYHRLLNFYRYLKNYDAPLYRKGKLIREQHRFANEREWRYVPPIDNDSMPFVTEATMKDTNKKNTVNEWLKNAPLVFEPKHINYVIIREEKERDEIISHIEAAKKGYPSSEVSRLKSRILTAEQIRADI